MFYLRNVVRGMMVCDYWNMKLTGNVDCILEIDDI
jgi:hypothetical protein